MSIKNRKRKLRGHTTEELWTINELKSSRLYHDHRGGSVDGGSDGQLRVVTAVAGHFHCADRVRLYFFL